MDQTGIFEQRYRVIAVEEQGLLLQGERSGEVLRLKNADPSVPLTEADYPPGRMITLSNPAGGAAN